MPLFLSSLNPKLNFSPFASKVLENKSGNDDKGRKNGQDVVILRAGKPSISNFTPVEWMLFNINDLDYSA